ncbi:MAG: tetratricopeptide repeat protein [Candidatus Melainabacteria bacterium]|nr:MAG: tetratricopeptide repeat protein [Candidatus Melainabacteria bacterium]
MNKYLTDIRLGDLLAKTGIVTAKQVNDAVRTAGNKNLHFGQILVLSGYLKSSDLKAGIEAQSAIRDRSVDREAAGKALEKACSEGLTFNEALSAVGAAPESIPTNRLGELIVDSGLLTAEQCKTAIDKSLSTGLPLGRILVTNNLISEDTLVNLLEIQMRVRDQMLTREQALALIAAGPDQLNEQDMQAQGQKTVRLGELLVRARILSRTDVINVLEVGLHANEKIGQLLVGFGFISPFLLECALNLQQMVENKFIRTDEAAKCLKHIEAHNTSISEALVQLGVLQLPKITSQGTADSTLAGGNHSAVNKFFSAVDAGSSSTKLDSTFGEADQTSWNALDMRTRRLVRSLRSTGEPKPPQALCTVYGELVKAYKNLATRHVAATNLLEAEWLYERVLSLKERTGGRLHPSLAVDLKNLAEVQISQRKFDNAERSVQRAIALLEQSRPYNGALLANCLNMLAMIYFDQGFHKDAEPLLTRALTLKELHFGHDHVELADTLRDYARLLAKTERNFEAEKVYFQARSILARQQRSEGANVPPAIRVGRAH